MFGVCWESFCIDVVVGMGGDLCYGMLGVGIKIVFFVIVV